MNQTLGPDGKPVVKESHQVHAQDMEGRHESRYSYQNSATGDERFGVIRGDSQRATAVDKKRVGGQETTSTRFRGMTEADLPAFDAEWQKSITEKPFWQQAQPVMTRSLSARPLEIESQYSAQPAIKQ